MKFDGATIGLIVVTLGSLAIHYLKPKLKIKLPKKIYALANNKEVMAVIEQAIQGAATMSKLKSNDAKRAYVRDKVKFAVKDLVGEFVPNSVLNTLIELIIQKGKTEPVAAPGDAEGGCDV